MNEILTQLITAFTGSLGFAMLFHLRRRLLTCASLGGLLSWAVYLAGEWAFNSIFIACLLASAFAALYSEILARLLKAPATVFFIPTIVPLIPGSTLYYTMSHAVQNDWPQAKAYALLTLQYTLSIAIGISFVWALFYMLRKIKPRLR